MNSERTSEKPLTSALMGALGSLPIKMRRTVQPSWVLPSFGPSITLLRELSRRGLAHYVEGTPPEWRRTGLGEAVWARR